MEFRGLCTLVDNTGSMGHACTAAREAASEIKTLTSILLGLDVASFAVYGDYDRGTTDNHQGGYALLTPGSDPKETEAWFAKYMKPQGGGGTPEAQKTSFNLLLRDLSSSGYIVFHYTDAPPHPDNDSALDEEGIKEAAYLRANQFEKEWDSLSALVKKSFSVVTFLTRDDSGLVKVYSKMGDVVVVASNTASVISSTMMKVLLAMIGQKQDDSIVYHRRNSLVGGNSVQTSNQIKSICDVDLRDRLNTANPNMVIDAFDKLLDPGKPRSALCLATNPILGKYWRLICGRYKYMDDGNFEKDCQRVMDKLSQCKASPALSAEDCAKLKNVIDASHDETPLIRKWIAGALEEMNLNTGKADASFLIYTGQNDDTIDVDSIRTIGRGGDFQGLADLLGNISVQKGGDFSLPSNEDNSPSFVPLQGGLSDDQILRLLANLLCPGTMFTKSEVMMIAVLGLYQKDLKEASGRILESSVGEWIKFDLKADGSQAYPTFWSLNFMRLLRLCPDRFLTSAEIARRDRHLTLSRIIRNHDATIELTLPLMLTRLREDKTWKRKCCEEKGGCGQYRCFTIFPGQSATCGLCLSKVENASTHKDVKADSTHWAQCFTCKANYGVVQVDGLNVRPKCHYCRLGSEVPTVECMSCLNTFVSETGAAEMAMTQARAAIVDDNPVAQILDRAKTEGKFVCPCCTNAPSAMIQKLTVKLRDLLPENPILTALIPLSRDHYTTLMDNSIKFWQRAERVQQLDSAPSTMIQKLTVKLRDLLPENPVLTALMGNNSIKFWQRAERVPKLDPHETGVASANTTRLVYNKYTVHDSAKVAERFQDILANHSGLETCPLCVHEVPARDMMPSCGTCSNRICKNCVRHWYSNCVPGGVVYEGNCKCPFCKSVPKHAVIKGLALSHIRNHRVTRRNKGAVCEWDPAFLYAACEGCLELVPALDRDCARAAPALVHFWCDACKHTRCLRDAKDAAPTKACPGCGVNVEKNGGCNHITCPTVDCGAHWCWQCRANCDTNGTAFDSHTIYDHMSSCAGVFGDDAETEE